MACIKSPLERRFGDTSTVFYGDKTMVGEAAQLLVAVTID